MRVVLLVPELRLGGAERSLVRLANELSAQAIDVVVLVFQRRMGPEAERLSPCVRTVSLETSSTSNPLLWLRARAALRRLEPDIAIGWSTYANLVTVIASWGQRWKTGVVERNYPPRMLDARWTSSLRRFIVLRGIRSLYAQADLVGANSVDTLRFLARFVGRAPRYAQFQNCVDQHATVDTSGFELPAELLDWSGPRLLAVGRLVHQKGFDVLLEALALVRRDRPWRLAMVGDGEEKEALLKQAEHRGLQDAIVWIRADANPYPYYSWAEIVIVPSRYEGFPNVLMEAMARGRATIAADCRTGPRELTDNGKYGVLVPVGDVKQLADQIVRLGLDEKLRNELGRQARQWVLATYDSVHVTRKIASVLKSCCGE